MEGPEGTRLASQAFEAINEAVRSAAGDTLPLVAQLIPLTLQKLNGTLAMAAAAPDARERQSEMQARRPRPMLRPTWSLTFHCRLAVRCCMRCRATPGRH